MKTGRRRWVDAILFDWELSSEPAVPSETAGVRHLESLRGCLTPAQTAACPGHRSIGYWFLGQAAPANQWRGQGSAYCRPWTQTDRYNTSHRKLVTAWQLQELPALSLLHSVHTDLHGVWAAVRKWQFHHLLVERSLIIMPGNWRKMESGPGSCKDWLHRWRQIVLRRQ